MKRYEVTPLPGYNLVIGRWLWAMQQTRKRRLRLVKDLDQDLLDWEGPDGRENAIGTLLYHIAGVEMGWLWWELKGHSGMPPEIEEDFPSEAADPETGWLTRVRGIPLAEHVRRLERNREVFLAEVKSLSLSDWRTPRLDRSTEPTRALRSGCCFTSSHTRLNTTSRSPRSRVGNQRAVELGLGVVVVTQVPAVSQKPR